MAQNLSAPNAEAERLTRQVGTSLSYVKNAVATLFIPANVAHVDLEVVQDLRMAAMNVLRDLFDAIKLDGECEKAARRGVQPELPGVSDESGDEESSAANTSIDDHLPEVELPGLPAPSTNGHQPAMHGVRYGAYGRQQP